MKSYLVLYPKRDQFMQQFATEFQKSRESLIKKGFTPVAARKRLKRNAWKWVKKYLNI